MRTIKWLAAGLTASLGAAVSLAGHAGASTEPPAMEPVEVETDIGVDDTTIYVGMLADQSGIFSPLVNDIVAAQQVYWDLVNSEGGIAGRQVELLVEDTEYPDMAVYRAKYDAFRDEVAIISMSTGSPQTSSVAEDLVDDELVAIPLTWYSGWADPDFGQNVFETYTNYCVESMNAIEWMHNNRDVETVAIVSFPGEYGQDGAAGAKMVVEELGLELVYDGEAAVTPPSADNPSPDWSGVIQQIVASDADLVWTTVNASALASIMGGVVGQGFDGLWSGNSPSYDFKLLDTDLAPVVDQYYIVSTYQVLWGTDVPAMAPLIEEMTAARPDLRVSDAYIYGWTEAQATHAILEQAAASGDMTRGGIVAAAGEVTVDFGGLAPTQSWAGEPNDYIVRESYLYDVSLEDFDWAPLGEGVGSTGAVLLEGPYVGEVASNFTYEAPCFEPTG